MENKEAMFFRTLPDNETVRCDLCPHLCTISNGKTGFCQVRKNENGTLYALNYAKVSSMSMDPIEKKPLKRYFPGSSILSVGSVGCNLRCPFCQNNSIARCKMEEVETVTIDSSQLVEKAIELKVQGNIGIAYTYNEPSIWYEYVYETAKLAKTKDLQNVLVTNGYISPEPLEQLLPYIDAMNIDLKSFNKEFYLNTLKGGLEEVKSTIRTSAKHCHVEVTTLVLPGYNDSEAEMTKIAEFLSSISPQIPLHLSRFFPQFEWADKSPTPVDTLYNLTEVAKKYLEYVYVGNV